MIEQNDPKTSGAVILEGAVVRGDVGDRRRQLRLVQRGDPRRG